MYKSPFELFPFYSKVYEVMTPFSKNPIMFGWKQAIQYMTRVTCDSVEKITAHYSLRFFICMHSKNSAT